MPFGTDSRALRWAAIYAPKTIEWGCWGSTAKEHKARNILDKRPRTGRFSFAMGYTAFVLMTFFFALKRLRRGDILLCVDLETALLGALAAKLRGATCHYDMADPFYLAKPVPFKWMWKCIEAMYIRNASIATAPLASRFLIFFQHLPANCRVVENVPDLTACATGRNFLPFFGSQQQLTFGYFGTIETHRGIEDLLQFVKAHPNTRLLIGGRGPLTDLVIWAAQACDRIQFAGEYLPEQLHQLTRGVDVYCSLYYKSKALHLFAAPNKYYEHLALGLPILISACTPFAPYVQSYQTGWAIDDGMEALCRWYASVINQPSAFMQASINGNKVWADRYSGYLQRQQLLFSEQ